MPKPSYEARKRFTRGITPLLVGYVCRRCGARKLVKVSVATTEGMVFSCGSSWCNTTWSGARYNIVWAVLSALGCRPAPYPEQSRYNQLKHYLLYYEVYSLGV